MYTSPKNKEQYELDTLEHLRQQPKLSSYEINQWLCSHINVLSEQLTGMPGRPLDRFDLNKENLKLYKEKPVLEVKTDWLYRKNTCGQGPSFKKVSEWLDGITIVGTAYIGKPRVSTTVRIELEKWPSLVNSLLAHNVYCIYHREYSDKRIMAKHCTDRNFLLQHFYPEITLANLDIAEQLGVIDKGSLGFIQWLERTSETTEHPVVTIPNDISASLV